LITNSRIVVSYYAGVARAARLETLFATGLGALGLLGWRRKRKAVPYECSMQRRGLDLPRLL
jgi:hypothetical protein